MTQRRLQECPIKCGRRHLSGHPHLEEAEEYIPVGRTSGLEGAFERHERLTGEVSERETTGNVSVVGADSPEALAAQAERATRGRSTKTRVEAEAELQRQRIESMRPLARNLAVIPYNAISLATFDKRWREKLREESMRSLEQATLNTMLAWGIEFSGKWSSVMALVLVHGDALGTIYQEIANENRATKAAQDEAKGKPN